MVMEPDWDGLLKQPAYSDSLRLVHGELLLLDWVLCTMSGLMGGITEDLVGGWHEFRLEVWRAIADNLESDEPEGVFLVISENEAKALLVAVPTAYVWGDGVDYGYSLKMKLSQLLTGRYIDPVTLRMEEPDADESTDKADDQAEASGQA